MLERTVPAMPRAACKGAWHHIAAGERPWQRRKQALPVSRPWQVVLPHTGRAEIPQP